MTHSRILATTALAPIIWGSSYIVTTQLLPNVDPLTISLLRALPAGLLLMVIVREVPKGSWILKLLVLGALNFSIFWSLLFFAAHRLPGGVAAVLGALQPLVVIIVSRGFIGTPIKMASVWAALSGVLGVGLLVITSEVKLDMSGVLAGVLGAASMAIGTVLSRKWQPPVSTLTFTAWQLMAGGLVLLPFALGVGNTLGELTTGNIVGLTYLSLIGAAFTYVIWLRGISKLQPYSVSMLGFFSPISAAFLGWLFLQETLDKLQIIGIIIVLISVFAGQFFMSKASTYEGQSGQQKMI